MSSSWTEFFLLCWLLNVLPWWIWSVGYLIALEFGLIKTRKKIHSGLPLSHSLSALLVWPVSIGGSRDRVVLIWSPPLRDCREASIRAGGKLGRRESPFLSRLLPVDVLGAVPRFKMLSCCLLWTIPCTTCWEDTVSVSCPPGVCDLVANDKHHWGKVGIQRRELELHLGLETSQRRQHLGWPFGDVGVGGLPVERNICGAKPRSWESTGHGCLRNVDFDNREWEASLAKWITLEDFKY